MRSHKSISAIFFLGFKAHWWAKSYYTLGSLEQFFAVSPENTDFSKKLCNIKIFSIKFVINKVILNFGVRRPLLLKTMLMAPNIFLAHVY